jgi:hypothetical protein
MAVSMWMNVVLEDGSTTDHLFPADGGDYGGGYGIPRHVAHLDEVCRRLGLPSLAGFVTVGDDGDPWFDPADGLTCVRGLLGWLAGAGLGEQERMVGDTLWARIGVLPPAQHAAVGPAVAAGVAADLRTFEVALAYALERRTRFQLYYSC